MWRELDRDGSKLATSKASVACNSELRNAVPPIVARLSLLATTTYPPGNHLAHFKSVHRRSIGFTSMESLQLLAEKTHAIVYVLCIALCSRMCGFNYLFRWQHHMFIPMIAGNPVIPHP